MLKKLYRKLRDRFSGEESIQTLLDKKYLKMTKTKEYEADDYGGQISFWYRFSFDNEARKRRFLSALETYPEQEWDKWITWWDDFSNFNGEFCVEAKCLVPPEELHKFKHKFKEFITRDLKIET